MMPRFTVWLILTIVYVCVIGFFSEPVISENVGICNQASLDYKDALSKAILFFEGQKSGKLPANHRVKWRGDSALADGKNDRVDLVGGYYDAGDNVKFGWPMAFTTTLLSWSAIEHSSEIFSAKQLGYLRQAIRWGSDFILKSHTSPTTLYTQVGDGNQDHQCWERPEDMDTPRTLYKITPSSPGTEAAADAAAALAAASIVFKRVDSGYSSKLLNHAHSLFDLADKYRGTYSASCPFYCSYNGYQDELLWAASWLYKASGNNKYLNYISSNKGWSQSTNEFSWDNKFAGVQILLAKEFLSGKKMMVDYKRKADSFVCSIMPGSGTSQIHTTPGGLLYIRDVANLQYVTSTLMIISIYAKALDKAHMSGVQCGSVNIATSKIRAFTKSQVDYILGDNPMKMSYMVGFGSKFPRQVHHRGASIPSITTHPAKIGCHDGYTSWFNTNEPNPNVHVGAIVAGPGANDQFHDVRSDHAHLEPTTYINAAFLGSVAPLLSGKHAAECKDLRKLSKANETIGLVNS